MARIEKSTEVWHRDDFALLCEWRRLYRVVEVGVDRGDFAQCFLSRSWNCEIYLAVDAWQPYSEMPWDREADYLATVHKLDRFPAAKIVRGNSSEIAARIQQDSDSKRYADQYGFIYIDASHHKNQVLLDMESWWANLADNGIMAGHDWSMSSGDHAGVQEAVIEFAERMRLTIYLTADDPSSWYFYGNGMPGPDWKRC